MIEPEEMDFERLERPNAELPKGEKRVVQEGQKVANCAWWKFLKKMVWKAGRNWMPL